MNNLFLIVSGVVALGILFMAIASPFSQWFRGHYIRAMQVLVALLMGSMFALLIFSF